MRTVRNSSRLLAGGLHHIPPPEQAPHQGAAPGSRHHPPENRKSKYRNCRIVICCRQDIQIKNKIAFK